MGAASALESIFTLQGLAEGRIPPTINHRPDPQLDPNSRLDCVAEGFRKLEQAFALKNAFGFGGCNAAMVFQRIG
jgi:3-oxoacyl-[acyl-carrier-protein] synthase II